MEENIINIATLTIDTTKASDAIVATKEEIFKLQKANSELRKEIQSSKGDTTEQTKAFVENEAKLKALNNAYKQQQTALNEYTLEQIRNTDALVKSAKSEEEAIKQNKELLAIRKQVDFTTVEGRKAIELLNAKMDENNETILKYKNTNEKASTITGNYRQKIFELSSALDDSVPGFQQARTVVTGFTSVVGKSADTVTNYANSAIQGAKANLGFKTSTQLATETTVAQTVATESQTTAQKSMEAATKASAVGFNVLKVAIIASGIGALVILVLSVVTALNQSEAASDKFSRTLAGVKGILNSVFAVLRPVGEFLIDKIAAGFDLAGRAAEKSLGLISKGLKFIGFDNAAKNVDNFTKSVKGSIEATQKLADAEADYTVAQRQSQKIQLDYQKQAEKLRQQRDDETKTVSERIKINAQLGSVLKQQANEELKIANQATSIANLRIKLTGKNKENLDSLAEAQTRVSDIQERISGQESEQLSNLNSLRKEADSQEKERKAKQIELAKKQLENTRTLFESEVSTIEEKLNFYKKYYDDLNKLEADENKIKNAKDLSGIVLAIAKETIDGEIELQNKAIKEKENIDQQQKADLLANAEFLKAEQTKLVESSLLSEVDKNTALLEIQKGYNESVSEINKNFEDAEQLRKEEKRALDALDFELKLLMIEEQGLKENELKKAILEAELTESKRLIEEDKKNKIISEKQANSLLLIEEKKYAKAKADIAKIEKAQRQSMNLQMVKDGIGALQAIFGESKALSVASALINTYQGITAGVKLGYPAAIPAVAFAAATGFAAVKNILKTDKGSSGTPTATASAGTTVFESPAKTQTVANVVAPPSEEPAQGMQPVLVLETLNEVQKNQIIKLKSN
jgi:hypothetical protein